MKVSDKQEVSDQEVVDAVERLMRAYLETAKTGFELAMQEFQKTGCDPAAMQDLWFRFNATERRLMKDSEGKEWSFPPNYQ